MSLSPFDSFQSRFVTYLLNFPRTLIKVSKIITSNTHVMHVSFLTILPNISWNDRLRNGPVRRVKVVGVHPRKGHEFPKGD